MSESTRIDARLIYSASESDANMLWATRFFAPDPFIFIQKRGKRYLVMNDLELDRAKSQANVDKVLSYSDYQKRWRDRGTQFPTAAQILSEGRVAGDEQKIVTLLVAQDELHRAAAESAGAVVDQHRRHGRTN